MLFEIQEQRAISQMETEQISAAVAGQVHSVRYLCWSVSLHGDTYMEFAILKIDTP